MFNYLLYKIGQFISVTLPLNWAYRFAIFCSDVHYIFSPNDRKAVHANLKVIFPEKNAKEIAKIKIWVFRNFAKYLVDFLRFKKIDEKYIKKNVKIINLHHIDDALAKGKGAIIITAHLGNWELGGIVVAQLGYPLWAVALPHKEKEVNDFFNSQRTSKGLHVIPLGKAVRTCLNLFKENKLVALVGDRDFTAKGIIMDFFGKPTFLPEGPAAFALKSSASIIPGFILRNPDDTFTLDIQPPIQFAESGDKDKDLKNFISTYTRIFEKYIRDYPDQWYTFRKFWIEKDENLHSHTRI